MLEKMGARTRPTGWKVGATGFFVSSRTRHVAQLTIGRGGVVRRQEAGMRPWCHESRCWASFVGCCGGIHSFAFSCLFD